MSDAASEAEVIPPAPGRWSRWEGLRRLSERTPLRTKLITAVLALVILALAAISVASVVMLRNYVETRQDHALQVAFRPYFNAPTQPDGSPNLPQTGRLGNYNPIQPRYAYTSQSDLIWALQQPGSQVNWYSTFTPPGGNSAPGIGQASLPELPTGNTWASSPNGVLLTVSAQSGPDSWRVIAQTQSYPVYNSSNGQVRQQNLTLVAAVDLGDLGAMTARLVLFDLVVGGAIVVVLAALSVALIRANLRPLNDIELTAGQIAAGHLNHRVPEGDPRTEVGSLGRSLNAMLAQIERAFIAQEESERAAHESEERMRRFIADASHELRTPLTTIRGFAAHYRQRGGIGGPPGEELTSGPVSEDPSDVSASGAALGGSLGNGEDQEQLSGTGAVISAPSGAATTSVATTTGMSPTDVDHLMARVEAEATRMGLLVEDLLTLARLDQARPLTVGPVDLLTVAVDAVQDARIVAPGRPVDLIVAPGAAFIVNGDEPRLRQVVGNLVNNALTHTPAATPVRVRIGAGTLEVPGGTAEKAVVPAVVLDVEDDGPGMAPEQARRVFERFYRADAARNRLSGGTGLGLAIVAGLVAAHGGTVSVRTEPGAGADFQVRLPLAPDAQLADADDEDV